MSGGEKRRSLSITYRCCKAKYTVDLRLFANAADSVPVMDRWHADDHPECPPLDAPLPSSAQT